MKELTSTERYRCDLLIMCYNLLILANNDRIQIVTDNRNVTNLIEKN